MCVPNSSSARSVPTPSSAATRGTPRAPTSLSPLAIRAYDLGFRKQGETFELVADWYCIKDINQGALTARLTQRYAYHTVKEKLDQQGFSLVEEEVKQDQTIHLVLRRTV